MSVPPKTRILLLEDSSSDAAIVQRMVHDAAPNRQYEFNHVPRLVDGLYLLDNQSFDLALLDLNLLDIDGVASVSALHSGAPNLPIIVMTGMDNPETRHQAMMCGARHYLVKGRQSAYTIKFMLEQALAA